MGSEAVVQPGSEPGEPARLGFFGRLAGIYFEPKKTFEDIDRKRSWVGMFVIMAMLAMAAGYALTLRVDPQTMMRKGLERNPFTKNMAEEQKERILARPVNLFQRYSQVIFAPVGILVVYLASAGVLLLVMMLMGASVSYKKSLAVTVWGLAAPGAVHLLLALVLVFLKDPDALDVFNVVNNVASNLGVAVVENEHPVLHSILSSIDVFSAWAIYLLALGFSTVSRGTLAMRKAAIGVMIPWALYVGVKTALAGIFS
jgi:hypothetical protein